ncbi:MAG TPA: hypothetical protein VM841_04090 [Actinomycetota bacterium]|nr:hypothetical protein [Actinomycetota bacterium]
MRGRFHESLTPSVHPPKIRATAQEGFATNSKDVFAALVSARRGTDRAARDAERAELPEAQMLRRARAAADASPGDAHAEVAAKQAEARARTEALEWQVERLRALLAETKPVTFDYEATRPATEVPPFDAHGLDIEEPPPPAPPQAGEPGGLLGKLLPSARARHEAAIAEAQAAFERAVEEHARREAERKQRLADALADYERTRSEAESGTAARNREVDAVRAKIESGDPDAVAHYFAAILAAGDLPDGFPRRATVALDPGGRILVVDYELPGLEVVPAVQAYRYDVALDSFEEVPRPAARRKDLYALVIASVALRSVAELFESDCGRVVDEIAFNGYVHGIDRVSGEPVRPYLVSLRVTRDDLRRLDVTKTDPIVTMRTIQAAFSTNPADLAAVKQVVGAKAVGTAHLATSPDV